MRIWIISIFVRREWNTVLVAMIAKLARYFEFGIAKDFFRYTILTNIVILVQCVIHVIEIRYWTT